MTGIAMALGAAFGAASPAGAALAAPRRVGQAPAVARDSARLGTLAAASSMRVDVVLSPRDPAALAAFATAVSTPGNPLYGHYLAKGEFPGRFGPTTAAIDAVERSLRAEGLPNGHLSSTHLSIQYVASEATLARAFSVAIDRYRLPGGRIAFANTAAPKFAGSVARYIEGVIGLDDLTQFRPLGLMHVKALRPAARSPHIVTGGPQPCAAAVTAGPEWDSYTADQLASAYRFSSLYGAGDEGAGVSVALFELEPNKTTDIAKYQTCYGTSATVTYTKEDGGAGSGAGEGEAALDIEDIIGLAPKASIDVYQAPNNTTGIFDDYNSMVGNDTSKVISTSWGECESEAGSSIIAEEATIFQTAATQGQSVFAAAGDSGSEDCGTNALAVDDPASQTYVTGVGGTEITALGPAPTENVWNESATGAGAGGGGISSSHTMPSYQSGAPSSLNVVNANSSGSPCEAATGSYCREVPDVSADADPYSGYVIYWDGVWLGIGGTSAAAPLWAAFTALTDASSGCDGASIGFANPALYTAAATAYSADFNDITSGNNDYTGTNNGLYPAGTGYDMASGLGTPNGAGLPGTLCSGLSTGPAHTTTTLTANPTGPVVGQTVAYTATVAPAAPSSGTPTGTVTMKGDSGVLCTATLNEESPDEATCSTSYPAAGTDSVTATYNGDSNDLSSSSTPLGVTISQASTATAVGTSDASPVVGESVTYTATVRATSPGSGTPTGSVNFTGTAGLLCSATLDESSTDRATCTISYGSPGTDSVKATFNGDGNYSASTSGAVAETISKALTTTAISSSPSSPVVGQAVTYTATVDPVAPGSGTPGGAVTFTGVAGTICVSTLDDASPDTATCATTYTTSAGDTVTAAYGGNTDFAASVSPVLDQSVRPDATTTSVSANDTTPVVGQGVTYTATVDVTSPGSGTAAGTVTFTGDGGVLCSAVSLDGASPDQATCTASYAAAGADSVTATYNGSTNDLGSVSSALPVTISPAATSTSLVVDHSSVVVGQTLTFTATVSPVAPGSGLPTGTVTFAGAAGTLCTASLGVSGQATCTTSYDEAGTDSVTATYGGNSNFSASASSAVGETISPAATTTSVVASVTSSVVGQQVTFTASVGAVSPGAGTPSGTVSFSDGVVLCGSVLTDTVPDQATCTVSFPAIGVKTVTATFEGSGAYTVSASHGVKESVSAAGTTTSVSASSEPSVTGQNVTFTATVAAAVPSTGEPSGHVVFSVETSGDQSLSCTGTSDTKALKSGKASCTIEGKELNPSVSPLTVDATYEGTTAYKSSQGSTQHDVDKAATSVTVSSSANPSASGQSVTFTATVKAASPGAGTVGGTLTFSFSPKGSLACTKGDAVILSTAAKAVCTLAKGALTASVTITAAYGGSSSYKSGSGSLSQTVS
ncbi:MAG: Ig-like domain repeat protein [Acidimicrobiales bacterium]